MPAYDGVLFTPPAPLALVSIHDPSSGETVNDVPMLPDTGADITIGKRSKARDRFVKLGARSATPTARRPLAVC